MRKTIFKKILTVLDQIELQGVTLHDTPLRVYEELVNDYAGYKLSQVKEGVDFLYEKQVLKEGKNGIDLNPAPTIYAKSNQNSSLEALSLMETFILDPAVYSFYKEQAVQNLPVTIEELQKSYFFRNRSSILADRTFRTHTKRSLLSTQIIKLYKRHFKRI